MRLEFLLDALTDYEAEPDNPDRSVPNPARKELEKQICAARTELARLRENYGSTALNYLEDPGSTMRAFTKEEKRIRKEIEDIRNRVDGLTARRKVVPTHIPLANLDPEKEQVKLSTEQKHLKTVLKMVAYQIKAIWSSLSTALCQS